MGSELEPGGQAMGLSGEHRPYAVASGLDLAFAGYYARIDARVADSPGGDCGESGLLGLDALGCCALVLSATEVAISCDR